MPHAEPPDASPPWRDQLAVLDQLADAIVAADVDGAVVYVNRAAERLLGWPAAALVGGPLTRLIPARLRQRHLAGMGGFVAGAAPRIFGQPVKVPALHHNGAEIDIELTLSLRGQPRRTAPGVPLVIACLRDLRARVDLERQLAEQRSLLAQHAAMAALVGAQGLEDAMPRFLRALCRALGWSVGLFWQPDVDQVGGRLDFSAGWTAADVGAQRFAAAMQGRGFAPLEAAPGQAWAAAQPLYQHLCQRDPLQPRVSFAFACGLRLAVIFPIVEAGRVLGVVECLGRTYVEPDDKLLHTLATLSLQLGLFWQRQRARESTARSQGFLTATVASIRDAVVATDDAGRIILANEAFCGLAGGQQAQLLGRPVAGVLGAAAAGAQADVRIGALVSALLAGDDDGAAQAELEAPVGSGRVLHLTGAPIVGDADGTRPHGAVMVLHDVTERRDDQEASALLAQVAALFAGTLRLPRALAGLGELLCGRLCVWMGVTMQPADAADGPLEVVAHAHQDPALREDARQLLTWLCSRPEVSWGPGAMVGESQMRAQAAPSGPAAGGPSQWAALAPTTLLAVPLAIRGRSRGCLCLYGPPARAFAARQRPLAASIGALLAHAWDGAQLLASAQSALAARDSFLAVASHELRTPLTSLQLQVQATLRRAEALGVTAPLADKLGAIQRHIGRLDVLIGRLLVGTAGEDAPAATPGATSSDLASVARATLARFSREMGGEAAELRLEGPTSLPGPWGPQQVEQVLSHLISNAIKFGAGRPVRVALSRAPRAARIVVEDQGMGIDAADQSRIFERFERAVSARNYSGFGLGLWDARQIVHALGGEIQVHSRPRRGSRFVVELPL